MCQVQTTEPLLTALPILAEPIAAPRSFTDGLGAYAFEIARALPVLRGPREGSADRPRAFAKVVSPLSLGIGAASPVRPRARRSAA